MNRAGRRRSEAGFTVIELIVVLALLALAYALVAPSITAVFDRPRLDNAARNVAGSLREARALAIETFRDTRFVVAPDRRSWQSGERTGVVAEGIDLSLERPASRDKGAKEAKEIVFFPDGSSTGGRVLLRRGERIRVIAVEWLTGRVSERPE
ncbi:MAG: GspH/FimT family pseudopilin [Rhodospirillales bacterium]